MAWREAWLAVERVARLAAWLVAWRVARREAWLAAWREAWLAVERAARLAGDGCVAVEVPDAAAAAAAADDWVVESFAIGTLGCNCSLVYRRRSRQAIVIDPGDDPAALLAAVGTRNLVVTQLLHTHAHFDHIGGSDEIKRRLGVPILLHRDDEELYRRLQEQGLLFGVPVAAPGKVDRFIEEGYEVELGSRKLLTTIHTPGHSPGSCCFYTEITGEPLLFAGDTLFRQSVGRTDLPGGDPYALIKSIKQRLFQLPPEAYVVPGHGPATTLAVEQRTNPFL